ncbi:gas vesicle protein GvpA/GvpJ/GvpM family [Actinocorallia herbida]|uniref:Gas vesicle protein GvpA/GvpJ/GvpM family n=1 Tax=Actinocorallia herbida TaxID=58109 RepID=A0A3N1CWI6_9ACTN|nr:gas vesicle protein [Actinocorallia herbida]ROO85585.1 gas vesicle protein GvpA/GvpJ/GvpM family [Actinocorallia herbida]
MSEPVTRSELSAYARPSAPSPYRRGGGEPANLADILERVLDKGIVIAGDIQVNLLDIELLTVKLRLVVASVDRAKEMGIDWWEHDPTLSSGARSSMDEENRRLRDRIAELEADRVAELEAGAESYEEDDYSVEDAEETEEDRRG